MRLYSLKSRKLLCSRTFKAFTFNASYSLLHVLVKRVRSGVLMLSVRGLLLLVHYFSWYHESLALMIVSKPTDTFLSCVYIRLS